MGVIEDIRSGNKEAIKEVYKENVRDVYNFAKSITGNHETALEATKKTFVVLFTKIQQGETPANIRLSALKIAYDEACAIAMPSTDAINSPYDKKEEPSCAPGNAAEPSGAQGEGSAADIPRGDVPEKTIRLEAENRHSAAQPAEEVPEQKPEEVPAVSKVPEETAPPSENPPEEKTAESPASGAAADAPAGEAAREEGKADPQASDDKKETGEIDDYYYRRYKEEETKEKKDKKEKKLKRRSALSIVFLIINIILILILIWFLLGLFQNLGIIPDTVKMGHDWFNDTFYPIF